MIRLLFVGFSYFLVGCSIASMDHIEDQSLKSEDQSRILPQIEEVGSADAVPVSEEAITVEKNEVVLEEEVSQADESVGEDEPIDFEETSTKFKTQMAIGIGFEDGGDNDHNDLVLCMKGQFIVDIESDSITSLNDQSVELFLRRSTANANHILRVFEDEVTEENILVEEGSFDNREERVINIDFRENQVLRVGFGNERHDGNLQLSKGINFAKVLVEKDTCRNQGS